MLCNLHNGFYGEPEKRWAVDALRALWEEAHERYDPQEIYVWAATHGWAMKDAKRLHEIAEGVREGKTIRVLREAVPDH
jgi:endonuclease IV